MGASVIVGECAAVRLGQRGEGQDRVAIVEKYGIKIAAVADGAGGISGGAEAADAVIAGVTSMVERGAELLSAAAWTRLLLDLDAHLSGRGAGQAAAVVIATDGRTLVGSSVGDCGAWLVGMHTAEELTGTQVRRPLLGGGGATPVPFKTRVETLDTVLLGSDGLFRSVDIEPVLARVRLPAQTSGDVCSALVRLVQLDDGTLQDDLGICVVRCR
jgi:serine/threonine protein phosphatase PrpC